MTQDAKDICSMRQLFWQKFYGKISQSGLEAEIKKIMDRQLSLAEVSR